MYLDFIPGPMGTKGLLDHHPRLPMRLRVARCELLRLPVTLRRAVRARLGSLGTVNRLGHKQNVGGQREHLFEQK
jgi:hypothetical protein